MSMNLKLFATPVGGKKTIRHEMTLFNIPTEVSSEAGKATKPFAVYKRWITYIWGAFDETAQDHLVIVGRFLEENPDASWEVY